MSNNFFFVFFLHFFTFISSQVYRTDLITAMKIPDYQLLLTGSYFNLTDAWKQEWEKGVQVCRQFLFNNIMFF